MYNKLRFLLLLFPLFAEAQMLSRTQVDMGTFITITLQTQNRDAIQRGFEIISEVKYALSSYDKDATIYKLNHQREVTLDAYSYEALLLCKKYYKETNHHFNIAIGAITKELYRFGEEERLVSRSDLQKAVVNFNGIHFDRERATLDTGITLDLGGMGKGYGVDRVADYFSTQKIDRGIISASGDIRCLDICSIEVQNPFGKTPLASFKSRESNSAISTSGNYNRYIESPKNNHLINPKSRESQSKFISITLISKLANSDIDAYATAASVMPQEEAYAFLDSLALAYIILQSDKKLIVSKNISEYTQELSLNNTLK